MKVRLKVFEWSRKSPVSSTKLVFNREIFVTDFVGTVSILQELFFSDSEKYYTFQFSTLPHAL